MSIVVKALRPGAAVACVPTELGWLAVAWRDGLLAELTFGHADPAAAAARLRGYGEPSESLAPPQRRLLARLQRYAAGGRDDFRDVAVEQGEPTDFQRRVIAGCRAIGYGAVLTYQELAAAAGSPRAARAVGNVMAANRVPLVIPCHRVVGAHGGLGGFSAGDGVRLKLRLLEQECPGRFGDRPGAALARCGATS